jgi:membrane protein
MGLRELPARATAVAARLGHRLPNSLRRAVITFTDQRGAEAAAGMAYYAVLSIFPLLVFLVAAASLLLEQERVYNQLSILLKDIFPLPSQLLSENFDEVLHLRAPVGLIALATLLWSGIGFFSALSHHISQAWPEARLRNFLGLRVMGLKMAGVLLLLLILAVILSIGTGLLPRVPLILPEVQRLLMAPNWPVLSRLVPWLASFVLFFALYRWVPNTYVTWRAALLGGVVASLGWQLVTAGFSWYVGSGLATFEVVYGSLGGVVAVMIWIYLSNYIAIFGAHLTAAVDTTRPQKPGVGPVMQGSSDEGI